jgi:hypothetical protein
MTDFARKSETSTRAVRYYAAMAERFLVESTNPDGELEPELVAVQGEPRSVQEILELCRSYRVHARISDPTGADQGRMDPNGGFSPT